MLTLLLILAMFGQGQSLVDYGLEFITAFPENVAYFYPFNPENSLNITALHPDTEINIYYKEVLKYNNVLQSGQTDVYVAPVDVEERNVGASLKTIRVVSSDFIVVLSIHKQGGSVQVNVVQPHANLDVSYSIPKLNYNDMLSKFSQAPGSISERYKYFRLIVINAEGVTNSINIVKNLEVTTTVLQPYNLLQLALNDSVIAIESLYKVAVIVAHPCLEATSCKCNMMVNQLRPDAQLGQSFLLPFLNAMTWLHMTVGTLVPVNAVAAGTLEPIQSQYITTAYPASLRLISPGLVLEVIPEMTFAACYLVHYSVVSGNVSVIAETLTTSYVYKDNVVLSTASWTPIANTIYSVTTVTLSGRHVIWHPTSKIAVYMFRNTDSGVQYGSLAVVLSETLDPDGCLIKPPEITVAPTPMSWTASHQYCSSTNNELFSPSTVIARSTLAQFLNTATDTEYWFGLRRSLLTLDWYWQKGNDSEGLVDMEWGVGEPSDPVLGMCACISSDMTWKSVRCCTPIRPMCYKKPVYFPLI